MIDPKLNEIPVSPGNVAIEEDDAGTLSDAQKAERLRRSRAGLSIRDTVAGDTLLSVGSRGVDVSGVEGGAGAGAGTTALTPGTAGTPAPSIVAGGRSTGMTTRSDSAAIVGPAATTEESSLPASITSHPRVTLSSDEGLEALQYHEIASRAYECWNERGCPDGSPEVDWHRAVHDLRNQRRLQSRSSGATA